MLIGGPGRNLVAELVIGNAQRGIEGPVIGRQFDGAIEKRYRILGAAFFGKRFAIFGNDAGIVRRHQHQLGQGVNGIVVMTGQAHQLGLAHAAFQIGGRGLVNRAHFFLGMTCRSIAAGQLGDIGMRRGGATGEYSSAQQNENHTGGDTQHGWALSHSSPPVCQDPGQQTLKHVELYG